MGELGACTVTPVTATSPTVIVEYTATAADAVRTVPGDELERDVEVETGIGDGHVKLKAGVGSGSTVEFEDVKIENGVSAIEELMFTAVGRMVAGPTSVNETLETDVSFQ